MKAMPIGTRTQTLAGEWRLVVDPRNVGRAERWFQAPRPESRPAPVPGFIQQVFPDYHGVAWYWHEFVPAVSPPPAGRWLLRFWAVDYLAEVWLNGQPVGGHEGGETPFTFDVTEAVVAGRPNRLAVRVLNPTNEPIDGIVRKETTPFSCGGIMDTVEFLAVPSVRIADLYARPDPATGRVAVRVSVYNALPREVAARLTLTLSPALTGTPIDIAVAERSCPPGDSLIEARLEGGTLRLWEPRDPYLYRIAASLEADGVIDQASARCGFRDFRIADGAFRLNGRRLFLRCSHTGNPIPPGHLPRDPDYGRRDLIYVKAMGFNAIRFLAGMPSREQLDCCDEIGLMVYEENRASWLMGMSSRYAERYERSFREMILRDRNHPCVIAWGLLNESGGPVFRHSVESLPWVRALDDTRLIMLNSGRFDGELGIASASNPGSSQWNAWLGEEAPGGGVALTAELDGCGLMEGMGDVHMYPRVPHRAEVIARIRSVGRPGRPAFLSEYGIGSAVDLVRVVRLHEQLGQDHATDDAFLRSNLECFMADWERWGMAEVFGRPEDYFRQALRRMGADRLLGLNAIRSNPNLMGCSMTSTVDGVTGEGLFTFFRELKPGTVDAVADGLAPLRWCLFAEPPCLYRGAPVRLEAVLANEDVLRPGAYEARLEVFGPGGNRLFERRASIVIPSAGTTPLPLALPVLDETWTVDGPAGRYRLTATITSGAAPAGGEIEFHVGDPADMPAVAREVVLWSEDPELSRWLSARGIPNRSPSPNPSEREVLLVSDRSAAVADAEAYVDLACRVARGATVVLLSTRAFARENEPLGWFPWNDVLAWRKLDSDLYNKDEWARRHPVFDGLPAGGLLDEAFYRDLIPHEGWDGQSTLEEALAGANRCSLHPSSGYSSGLLLSVHRLGAGRVVLNSFLIRECLGRHPAADRLLLNVLNYAACLTDARAPLAPLPDGYAEGLYRERFQPLRYGDWLRRFRLSPPVEERQPIRDVPTPPAGLDLSRRPVKDHRCPDGFISICRMDGESGGLVYGRTLIDVPVAMSGELLVGVDGPLKVWLDDAVAGVVDDAGNPAQADRFRFPVALTSGRHAVTVAFSRRGGKAWGFSLRFLRADVGLTDEERRRGLARMPVELES